jgi:hypothetical protein
MLCVFGFLFLVFFVFYFAEYFVPERYGFFFNEKKTRERSLLFQKKHW